MSFRIYFLLALLFLSVTASFSQDEQIYSKEGKPLLYRAPLISSCLRSMNKTRFDDVALGACECYVNKLNRRFTMKEFNKYTDPGPNGSKSIDLEKLVASDSAFKEETEKCFSSTGKTILMAAEGFRERMVATCMSEISKSTNRKIDNEKLKNYCECQLELITQKQLSDQEVKTVNDPNSLFFFEVAYKCGSPFADSINEDYNWNVSAEKFVRGPASDTIAVLELKGMSYLKIKVGSLLRIWLFDTGATDMLITSEMEKELRKENVITDNNYTGTHEYEMANGTVEVCRTYKINNLRIGKYYVDDVKVAVSEKSKRTIAGRTLFNKFRNWSLDNRTGILILNK